MQQLQGKFGSRAKSATPVPSIKSDATTETAASETAALEEAAAANKSKAKMRREAREAAAGTEAAAAPTDDPEENCADMKGQEATEETREAAELDEFVLFLKTSPEAHAANPTLNDSEYMGQILSVLNAQKEAGCDVEIADLDEFPHLQSVMEQMSGDGDTLPQIFLNGEYLPGGLEQLKQLAQGCGESKKDDAKKDEAKKDAPPEGSENWTFPVLLFITRTVDDSEAYKKAWAEGAKKSMEAFPNDLKVCVSYPDPKDPHMHHEFVMANKPEAVVHVQEWFFKIAGMPGVEGGTFLSEYKFGHDRPIKYDADRQGFIKDHSGVDGPPVVVISTRFPKAGKQADIFKAQAAHTKEHGEKLGSLMASCSLPAEFTEDPDAMWDLEVHGDWKCYEDHKANAFASEDFDEAKPRIGFVISDDPAKFVDTPGEFVQYAYGKDMTGELGSFK